MYSWDSIFMQFPYFRSKGWQCFKFTCLRECNVTPVITSKSIFYSKVLAVGGLLVAQLYDIFHCYFPSKILECTRVGGGGLLENVWIFIFSQWVCNLSSWERVKKSWERAHWQRSPSNCLLSAKAGDKDVAKFEEGDIKQWEAKTLHDFQLFANWWQSCLEVLVHLMVGGIQEDAMRQKQPWIANFALLEGMYHAIAIWWSEYWAIVSRDWTF